MGKRVVNEDYAKPLFTRIYKKHRRMIDELVAIFPRIPLKYPRKDGPTDRSVTDTEIIQVAIEDLHKKHVTIKKHG